MQHYFEMRISKTSSNVFSLGFRNIDFMVNINSLLTFYFVGKFIQKPLHTLRLHLHSRLTRDQVPNLLHRTEADTEKREVLKKKCRWEKYEIRASNLKEKTYLKKS